MGRACLFKPLCKNSDAARGRALPPVERADAQTKPMHAARDAAEVLARSGRRRATHRHATRSCVMGGLWTEQKKHSRDNGDSDYGTSISDSASIRSEANVIGCFLR
jgi:hypothetical protein